MAFDAGTILARLKLQDEGFSEGLSGASKALLAVNAAAIGAIAGLAAMAEHTAKVRDEITKMARTAGDSAQDFSGLAYAASMSGVDIETLGRSMRHLLEPTGETATMLMRLGIATRDTSGHMKSSSEILGEAAEKVSHLDEASQAVAAKGLFGPRGAQMVNLLREGKAGIKELTDEAARMGLVFDDNAGKAAEKFHDDIERVEHSVDGFTQSIGQSIINLLNQAGIIEGIAKLIQKATSAWNALSEETKNFILIAISTAAGLTLIISSLVVIINLAPVVSAALTAAFSTNPIGLVAISIAAVVAGILALKAALDGSKNSFVQIAAVIFSAFFPVIAIVTGIITQFDRLKNILAPAIELVKSIGAEIRSAFSNLTSSFGSSGSNIDIGSMLSKSLELAAKVISIISILLQAFGSMFSKFSYLADVIDAATSNLIYYIKTPGHSIQDGFEIFTSQLKNGLEGFAEQTKGVLVDAGNNIKRIWETPMLPPGATTRPGASDRPENKNGLAGLPFNQPFNLDAYMPKPADWENYAQRVAGGFWQKFTDMSKADKEGNQTFLVSSSDIEKSGNVTAQIYTLARDKYLKEHPPTQANAAQTNAEADKAGREAAQKYTEAWAEVLKTSLKSIIDQAVKFIMATMQLAIDQISKKARTTANDMAIFTTIYDKAMQDQIDATQNAANKITEIEQTALAIRLGMIDTEFAAKKKAADDLFKLNMKSARDEFDLKKQTLINESADKEQAQLAATQMEQDWQAFLTDQTSKHTQDVSDILTQANLSKEAENKASQDTITAQTAATNAQLKALQEKKNKDDKDLAKANALMKYQYDIAGLNVSKQMQRVQAVMAAAQAELLAAAAWAAMAAYIPIAGAIIGGIFFGSMTALIGATLATTLTSISTQNVLPPAELFAAEGMSAAPPGRNIMVGEKGPEIIRLGQVSSIIPNHQAFPNKPSVTIQFMAGAIQNQGDMDDTKIQMLSQKLGDLILRRI